MVVPPIAYAVVVADATVPAVTVPAVAITAPVAPVVVAITAPVAPVVPKKRSTVRNFSKRELFSLLNSLEHILPIGTEEWESVAVGTSRIIPLVVLSKASVESIQLCIGSLFQQVTQTCLLR